MILFLLLSACNSSGKQVEKELEKETDQVSLQLGQVAVTDTPIMTDAAVMDKERDQCIDTFDEFAYIVVDEYKDYPNRGTYFPLPPWKMVYEFSSYYNYGLIGITNSTLGKGIWIGRSRKDVSPFEFKGHDIIIYYPESGNQMVVSRELGSTEASVYYTIFLSDGSVWATNRWPENKSYTSETFPMFSKYNPETNQFEVDERSFRIPMSVVNQGDNAWPIHFLGENGIIWFFIEGDGLYSYDTKTGETVRRTDIPEGRAYNTLYGRDGNVYFFLWPDYKDGTGSLYKYSLEEDQLSILTKLQNGSFARTNMIMDIMNQLWLGSISIVDLNGKQTILHPKYEKYLEKAFRGDSEYWSPPTIITESSNGYLWFNKGQYRDDSGTAWYDPKTGEGCWFTSFLSGTGIIEDDDHRMWIIVENKLYRYSL